MYSYATLVPALVVAAPQVELLIQMPSMLRMLN